MGGNHFLFSYPSSEGKKRMVLLITYTHHLTIYKAYLFMFIILFDPNKGTVINTNIPTLQIRKLKLREIKSFIHSAATKR